MEEFKEVVIIRKRKIKDSESLFLDMHVNGKRYRENLNLYLSLGTSR